MMKTILKNVCKIQFQFNLERQTALNEFLELFRAWWVNKLNLQITFFYKCLTEQLSNTFLSLAGSSGHQHQSLVNSISQSHPSKSVTPAQLLSFES